jgi:hypothetical protein
LTIAPTSEIAERRIAVAAYLSALLLGLAMSSYLFPQSAIFASDIRVRPVVGMDAATEVVAQRYFTKDSWRWPLFLIKNLATPEGTNLAFTDGIPFIELGVKVFRRFMPSDFHSVYLWLAICWVAQPMSAVFALRSAGERRLIPSLAVAVIAISMPTLPFRFIHAANCSHFVILIALGFYFQITRNPRMATVISADLLILAALLINPYIMVMVVAVLVAAPLTLLMRGHRTFTRIAFGIGIGLAISAVTAWAIGYGHAIPERGYGYYTMNLLSPVSPAVVSFDGLVSTKDGLYQHFPSEYHGVDATGGQRDGFQYLGLGLILLLLVADFCLNLNDRLTLLRRHGGLVLACVGLTLMALSTKVYAGNRLVLDLPAPGWLSQFRSSGRFFWPVAYTLLIISILIVSRKLTVRWATAVLLLFSALQVVDAEPMYHEVRAAFQRRKEYSINTALFRSLLASHSRLIVWPKYGCGADPHMLEFSELFLLASEVAVPVNTAYVSRFGAMPDCKFPKIPVSVGPGDLWVFLPKWTPAMVVSIADWNSICRLSGTLAICARDLRDRMDLPVPNISALPLGQTVSVGTTGVGRQWLLAGWYDPEPWAVWSEGSLARLAVALAKPTDKSLIFTVRAVAFASRPSSKQRITVSDDGEVIATWEVKDDAVAEYSAVIPARSVHDQTISIDFHIDHPTSPKAEGRGGDTRNIGLALIEFRLDEQNGK